jgi:serine/threonine protein kinase
MFNTLLPMNSETPPSSDPLFGNNVSDLMREAMDPATRIPTGDPRYWQPPTPEDLQARLGGAYLVEAFLARGGMGAVYRGIQASLERPVAIKILPPQLRDADPSFAQRFKQEAKAMAQLNHPSIVSVYDFGEMPDGTLYFIMEFVDGTDVAQMVTRQGRLSSAHAMAITAHVCDALQYAHEHGVVHRDIKPANIMVGNDCRVKVADFGLAKSSRVTATSLTMTGHVMGTPHFLAPEALTLGSTVDHRADIYAVGVMLYQMLTGRLPQGIFEMPSLLVAGLDPRYDAIIASRHAGGPHRPLPGHPRHAPRPRRHPHQTRRQIPSRPTAASQPPLHRPPKPPPPSPNPASTTTAPRRPPHHRRESKRNPTRPPGCSPPPSF